MAGPILNVKIFTRSTAHTLRAISAVMFPPGFILLLIQGIVSEKVNPAIGILPLFFSAAFSLFLLANEKQCGCQSSGLTGTPIHLVVDLLIAICLLVCLILDWVHLIRGRGLDSGDVMLGTYCTNFLMVDFLVHLYFTVNQLYESLTPGAPYSGCPACQFGPFTVAIQRGTKNGYAPLLDSDGQPRVSNEEGQSGTVEDAV